MHSFMGETFFLNLEIVKGLLQNVNKEANRKGSEVWEKKLSVGECIFDEKC